MTEFPPPTNCGTVFTILSKIHYHGDKHCYKSLLLYAHLSADVCQYVLKLLPEKKWPKCLEYTDDNGMCE